ncbi:hypothetical protein [Klebsiella pneumoniae]|uniref:hypothetical protein n=1 Tax=Klebsiella pneumoniae TaxID=573 RepID=UPI000B97343D|nr:hypothetical protein [Klebsiella pneumoniae]MCS6703487.1 hypothetical protein [Klebsiella pneumoniae subsp. pneumoniae]QDJ76464.1 hypothetical protein CI667_0008055 [Klebsiella pneumoniae subsp. pneumoniae]HBR0901259.1 hypothetical protein [Klebsiella pneumoniae]HBR0906650.1 hypothetical protein [Klebsiella pneumoniae]HBR1656343.1 hypothetical protein [Klebsiella pneumoniae]
MTTETVETNQPDEQDGTFDRNYTEVKRLKVLIADDGTKIPFSANMKVVYAYLYTFQTNKDRRNYPGPIHPNMEIIAWENGITKPMAQKAVDDLMRAGVLIKDQIQVGSGFKSNNYVVLKPSKVVARGVTPPHPNASKYSTAEESGKNEQKRAVESFVLESAAPIAGKPDGVPPVGVPVDVDLSGCDDPSLSDLVEPDSLRGTDAMKAEQAAYTSEQLHTKLRKWRNWGLDDEARAFCLSQSVNDDTDSMALFIQRYQMPVLHQIPGEIPQWDEKIPF